MGVLLMQMAQRELLASSDFLWKSDNKYTASFSMGHPRILELDALGTLAVIAALACLMPIIYFTTRLDHYFTNANHSDLKIRQHAYVSLPQLGMTSWIK